MYPGMHLGRGVEKGVDRGGSGRGCVDRCVYPPGWPLKQSVCILPESVLVSNQELYHLGKINRIDITLKQLRPDFILEG